MKSIKVLFLVIVMVLMLAACTDNSSDNFVVNTLPTINPNPIPTEQPEAIIEEDPLALAYAAYYEILSEKTELYGIGATPLYEEAEWGGFVQTSYEGVIYAEMIDFENDGLPEMLIFWNDGSVARGNILSVYGYINDAELFYEERFYSEFGYGSSYTTFSLGVSDNRNYYLIILCDEAVDMDGDYTVRKVSETFYTVSSNEWNEAMILGYDYYMDYQTWERIKSMWTVDNEPVSEETFDSALQMQLSVDNIHMQGYGAWSGVNFDSFALVVPYTSSVRSVLTILSQADFTVATEGLSDEMLYAQVFEQIRNDIYNGRITSNSGYGQFDTISLVSYTFHDIDGNGVKELIVGIDNDMYLFYTLDENNSALYLFMFPGYRVNFQGISAHGHIVEWGSMGGGSNSTTIYKITADGMGVEAVDALYRHSNFSENPKDWEFEVNIEGAMQKITEAEYHELLESMTAPYVELDWKHLTELTGVEIPEGRHLFAVALEELNKSAEKAKAWYFPNFQVDNNEIVLAGSIISRFNIEWGYYDEYVEYRLFYIHDGEFLSTSLSPTPFIYFASNNYLIAPEPGYHDGLETRYNVHYIESGEVKSVNLVSAWGFRGFDEVLLYCRKDGENISLEQYQDYWQQYFGDGEETIILDAASIWSWNEPSDQTAEILAMTATP